MFDDSDTRRHVTVIYDFKVSRENEENGRLVEPQTTNLQLIINPQNLT